MELEHGDKFSYSPPDEPNYTMEVGVTALKLELPRAHRNAGSWIILAMEPAQLVIVREAPSGEPQALDGINFAGYIADILLPKATGQAKATLSLVYWNPDTSRFE